MDYLNNSSQTSQTGSQPNNSTKTVGNEYTSPDRYKSASGVECIDLIYHMTYESTGLEAFYIGNIVKYLFRFTKKNGIDDLVKAKVYLQFLIELYAKRGN